MTNRYAVIGNPIGHSLSPIIHQYFANQVGKTLLYEKIHGNDAEFEAQVQRFFNEGGQGLNVTLPFKQRAFTMASRATARCLAAKSANTLWRQGKQLWADNTDGVGLVRDLNRYINLDNKNVLLLGAGGAARGIIPPLLNLAITKLTIINRTTVNLLTLLQDFPRVETARLENLSPEFDLVINATSASFSDNKLELLPATILQNKPCCYDLAYDLQKPTLFTAFARAQGCVAYDGLGMLVEQAAEAFLIWHQLKPNTETVLASLKPRKIT